MATKLDEASQAYFSKNEKLAEWVVGLTISELAFIISQKLFGLNFLFYLFLFFSFSTILIAIVIMYVIVIVADSTLDSALLAVNTGGKVSEEEFGRHFNKRIGKIGLLMIDFMYRIKLYKWLIFSFLFGSILMVTLISKYLVFIKNCSNLT